MKANINNLDRLFRIIFGLILIVISQFNITNDPLLDIILLALGIYLIISAVFNYCFIYLFLDYSSIKTKKYRRSPKRY